MRSTIEQQLHQAWQTRGWLSSVLLPVALLFSLLVRIHQGVYLRGWRKPTRLPVPVVVVGNVLAGGVGKTPIVMALVERLTQEGLRVGVVARGYGRSAQSRQSSPICEVTANSPAHLVGDEPMLIHRHCQVPVWVGSKRVEVARALLAANPQVQLIISDDGLQHADLGRDIELCVFDERGIGNGWMLPAGPLREPWPRRGLSPEVKRFTLSTAPTPPSGLQPNTFFHVHRRLSTLAVQADGTQRDLSHWRHHPAHAIAGIAKPQAFFDMLLAHGVQLVSPTALPDHANTQSLNHAVMHMDLDLTDVLCTEKDAVKLWQTVPQAWAVPLVVDLPQTFWKELAHALASVLKLGSANSSGV